MKTNRVFTTLRSVKGLSSLALALGLSVGLMGCDGASDPEAEACGGEGILCNVSGVAGSAGFTREGTLAIESLHYWPVDVTVGTAGELYITDWNNHVVRKITPAGITENFIGISQLGDDNVGPADQLSLNHPTGFVIGDDGDYYLVAWHNWKIKKFDSATMETSVAVGSTQGFVGDGGPATAAKMDLPSSLVFDFDGNMYISDQANQRIRKVTTDGTINTFAGGARGYADGVGIAAQFSLPAGPDAGPGGRIAINDDRTTLYMADTQNHRIRKIDLATGAVTTIGGTGTAGYTGDGGPATAATFNAPADVYLTHDQELFIADAENNVIRKIDVAGNVSTVAGTGTRGFSEDATLATEAELDRPYGIAYDEANHLLYIADTFNHQIKRVDLSHAE
ncbi:MAG: hypothetical protein SH809_08120 [Rhodothermales bacterium]|nr:hypothetical protein [Rhodothermales bacterium]